MGGKMFREINALIEVADIEIDERNFISLVFLFKTEDGYLKYKQPTRLSNNTCCGDFILNRIIELTDSKKWSEVRGKYVRLIFIEKNNIQKIGNIVSYLWLNLVEGTTEGIGCDPKGKE
jgi:hypothetical protein